MSIVKNEEIIKKYFFFEYFINENYHYNSKILSKSNSANNILNSEKFNHKINFPIYDTLIIDNASFTKWLFTDINGYVMTHNRNKLNKKNILLSFIHDVKNFFRKRNLNNLASITDEKILTDLNRISSLLKLNVSSKELFQNQDMNYLNYYYNIYFILITYSDNKREFKNIIELYKILNDHFILGTIKLIQNLININLHDNKMKTEFNLNQEKFQNLIIHYSNINVKEIKLYFNELNTLIECFNKIQFIKLKNEKEHTLNSNSELSSIDLVNESLIINNLIKQKSLSKISNSNLIEYYNEIIFNLIDSMEKLDKIKIESCIFIFVKSINNKYLFISGNNLFGILYNNDYYIKKKNREKQLMDNILKKKVPKDIENFSSYQKITNNHFCNGEFCNYQIPKNLKGMKKITKTNEYLLNNKVPLMNKFSSRDNKYNLPNVLSLFIIKRVHDNPSLVNMLLKAYSIFPNELNYDKLILNIHNEKNNLLEKKKNNLFLSSSMRNIHSIHIPFFSDLNELSQLNKNNEIILYTPTKNKFEHINIDNIYQNVPVCYNCFIIYQIIDNYINTIDLYSHKFKNEKLAYSIMKDSDKVLGMDKINAIDNSVLHDSYKENCFIDSLKRKLSIKKKEYLNKNRKGLSVTKIKRSNIDKIFDKSFDYYININPKKFKINVINEYIRNEKYKMFKVNLEKSKSLIDINKERTNSALINRRFHLGYTGDYNSTNNIHTLKKKLTIREKQKNNQILDIDIVYNLKNNRKIQKKIVRRKTSRNLLKFDTVYIFKGKSDIYEQIKFERKKKEYFEDLESIISRTNTIRKNNNELNNNKFNDLENNKNIISKDQKLTEINLTDSSDRNNIKKIRITSVFYKTNIDEARTNFEITKKEISKFKKRNYKNENQFNLSITISSKEFAKIANLNWNNLLLSSQIFIYDNYTAIPYNITLIGKKERIKDNYKSINLIIFVLNDFFESYDKYLKTISKSLKKAYNKSNNISKIKIVSFNFPGQSNTIWQSEEILNNLYYKNFFDRFLFYLYHQKRSFNDKYKGFLIGFGNGGFVALSYLSLHEKYFPFFDGAILINSYLSKDIYINNYMNKIKIYLNQKQDCKLVKNYIESIINRNIEKLNKDSIYDINNENMNENELSDKYLLFNYDNDEDIKLNGILNIMKGYNYNIDIRNKNKDKIPITTPLVFIHSINNCFIPFKNIEDILNGIDNEEIEKMFKSNNNNKLDFTSFFRNKNEKDITKRKIIPIQGTHDMISNDETNKYISYVIKKFICDYAIVKGEKL